MRRPLPRDVAMMPHQAANSQRPRQPQPVRPSPGQRLELEWGLLSTTLRCCVCGSPYIPAPGENMRSNSPPSSALIAGRRGTGLGHGGTGGADESFVVLPDSTPLLSESYFSLSRTGGSLYLAGDGAGSNVVSGPAHTSHEIGFTSAIAPGTGGPRGVGVGSRDCGIAEGSDGRSRSRASSDASLGGSHVAAGGTGSGVGLNGGAGPDGYSKLLDRSGYGSGLGGWTGSGFGNGSFMLESIVQISHAGLSDNVRRESLLHELSKRSPSQPTLAAAAAAQEGNTANATESGGGGVHGGNNSQEHYGKEQEEEKDDGDDDDDDDDDDPTLCCHCYASLLDRIDEDTRLAERDALAYRDFMQLLDTIADADNDDVTVPPQASGAAPSSRREGVVQTKTTAVVTTKESHRKSLAGESPVSASLPGAHGEAHIGGGDGDGGDGVWRQEEAEQQVDSSTSEKALVVTASASAAAAAADVAAAAATVAAEQGGPRPAARGTTEGSVSSTDGENNAKGETVDKDPAAAAVQIKGDGGSGGRGSLEEGETPVAGGEVLSPLADALWVAHRTSAQLRKELSLVETQREALRQRGSKAWTELAELAHARGVLGDECRELLQDSKLVAEAALDLSNRSALSDLFAISHVKGFPSINGYRLGRAPDERQQLHWNEINASWGQAVLLVRCVCNAIGFRSQRFRLVPLNCASRVVEVSGAFASVFLFRPAAMIGQGGVVFYVCFGSRMCVCVCVFLSGFLLGFLLGFVYVFLLVMLVAVTVFLLRRGGRVRCCLCV